jgi:phage shock protein PspC (stress-responsive transcriptional regulator)
MNKTFNINLGGYPFAIDEDAYEYIQNYLGTIRRHFSASDGCEEILYDIEVRMAELFQEHLKGRAIISMKEIDEVIMIMGKPEDFGAEPMAETFQSSSKSNKSNTKVGTGKRLFRDPDDQKVAGVCSGIAAYFGVEDPLWVRLIFVLLMFTGTGVMAYIVLWALVPQAANAGDKLAMRGEPATIENIAKLVEDELTGLGDKINEWSKDLGTKKKSDNINPGLAAKSFLSTGVNLFGTVIGGIIPAIRKVFKPIFLVAAIIMLSMLGISWAASFVGLSLASPVMLAMGPKATWLGYLSIASLYFTIGLPLLGIMLYIARLAFGYKIHPTVKTSFWTLWFLSIFVSSFGVVSTVKEYSNHHEHKTITDYNIAAQDIKIVMPGENMDHSFGIHLGEFITEKDNQWAFRDVNFKIEPSKDQLVHIEKIVTARGANSSKAQQNIEYIKNDIAVNGNEISISKYITFPKSEKYRNQSIDYVIYVPEGKNIIFDGDAKSRLRESSIFNWDQIHDNTEDIKWTVKTSGMYSALWNDKYHHIKDVNTGKYNKIIIDEAFDVVITKSNESTLTFSGDKETISRITVNNLDGTLNIKPETDVNVEGITINIKTPNIEMIQLDGVNKSRIEGFVQENIKLISIGENNTEIEFLGNIKNMDISLINYQTLTMTGSGDFIDLKLQNGAKIIADKYIVKNAVLNEGDGDGSSLHITETFSSKEPEMMNVRLLGNPKKVKL